jgi:TPR repeat protein
MREFSDEEIARLENRSRGGDSGATLDLAAHYLLTGSRGWARDLYVIAANQGSSVAANAAAVLFAEEGLNREAVEWLKIACLAGNKLACTHLSIAYRGGSMGLEKDERKAAKYSRLGDLSEL